MKWITLSAAMMLCCVSAVQVEAGCLFGGDGGLFGCCKKKDKSGRYDRDYGRGHGYDGCGYDDHSCCGYVDHCATPCYAPSCCVPSSPCCEPSCCAPATSCCPSYTPSCCAPAANCCNNYCEPKCCAPSYCNGCAPSCGNGYNHCCIQEPKCCAPVCPPSCCAPYGH